MDSRFTKIPWDKTRNIFIELILGENTVCRFDMKTKFKILSVTLKNQSFYLMIETLVKLMGWITG